jgi:hypothetical protein
MRKRPIFDVFDRFWGNLGLFWWFFMVFVGKPHFAANARF